MGVHKHFRRKKDTVIPGVAGYQGGNIYSSVTGRTNTSDARGENLNSSQTTPEGLKREDVKYNAPSYLQDVIQKHKNPQLKNHYSNEDIRKADVDILTLSRAVQDMTKTLKSAEETAPHLVEANKPLMEAFEKANDYAMKQGFSLDQYAVNDRLDKYGYQDSSSKLGAMIGLANKRVGAYVNTKLQEHKLADELKTSHVDNLRKDISSVSDAIPKVGDSRATMLDTIMKTDAQDAHNIDNYNAQNSLNTSNKNALLNKDASNKAEIEATNAKRELMRQDLFSKIDSDMYDKLQTAKQLQDQLYKPEQRIRGKIPGQNLINAGKNVARGFAGVAADYVVPGSGTIVRSL